jgi:protein TonB
MPELNYPKAAREAGVDGTVIVKLLVGRDGRVKQVVVVQTVVELEAAAVDAARQAHFQPARKDGQPVEVWVQMPLTFKLRDAKR